MSLYSLAGLKDLLLTRLRHIVANTLWLFVDKMVRMGLGVVVGVWMARYLGPEEFGILNYVLAFSSFMTIFAGLGLDAIVVRKLVETPQDEGAIMANAFLAKVISGIAVTALSIAFVLFYPQSPIIDISIIILSASTVFLSLDVVDFYYQAKVLSKYVVIARSSSFVIANLYKLYLIVDGQPLMYFVIAAFIEIGLSALFLAISFFAGKRKTARWHWDLQYMRALINNAFPLLLSGFVIIVYLRIDQIMIGTMLGQDSVGVYSAAVKLVEIWYFIPTIICSSMLPMLIQTRAADVEQYHRRLRRLFSVLNVLSISIAIPTTFFSGLVINLIYGPEFQAAADSLSVSIWAGVFIFLSVGTGQALVVENFTVIALFRNLASALMNIGLNLIFIPRFGIVGAAWATLISYFFTIFTLLFFRKTRVIFVNVLKSFAFR